MVRWLITRKSKELEATYPVCEEPSITAIIYAIYCNFEKLRTLDRLRCRLIDIAPGFELKDSTLGLVEARSSVTHDSSLGS